MKLLDMKDGAIYDLDGSRFIPEHPELAKPVNPGLTVEWFQLYALRQGLKFADSFRGWCVYPVFMLRDDGTVWRIDRRAWDLARQMLVK